MKSRGDYEGHHDPSERGASFEHAVEAEPHRQRLVQALSEAREQITAKMGGLDAKTGSQVAWICYRAKAYDLACTLFLAHVRANLSYFKYLNALESAAARCGRIPQVLEAYRSYSAEAPHLYGRSKSLARRDGAPRI